MSDPAAATGRAPLLLFPCNGNALEALDALEPGAPVLGFVDDTPGKAGTSVHGLRVHSRVVFAEQPLARVLAVPGSPATYLRRRAIVEGLGLDPARWAQVIHPSARVSPRATIGRNVLVMAGVVISGNAVVGDHVCILPNTVIHHDARIGDWTLVGSNVTVAGHTVVGENAYVGSGTSLMNGITIGDRTLVGLGTCVLSDVGPDCRVVGNPHRRIG